MTNPIDSLPNSVSSSRNTIDQNFSRRLAWSVETLDDVATLTADQGCTLFRLDSTTNACAVALPAEAYLHVGWTVAFVLVEASNGGDVTPDAAQILGLDGGLASHKALSVVGEYLELVWTGDEFMVVRYYSPTP